MAETRDLSLPLCSESRGTETLQGDTAPGLARMNPRACRRPLCGRGAERFAQGPRPGGHTHHLVPDAQVWTRCCGQGRAVGLEGGRAVPDGGVTHTAPPQSSVLTPWSRLGCLLWDGSACRAASPRAGPAGASRGWPPWRSAVGTLGLGQLSTPQRQGQGEGPWLLPGPPTPAGLRGTEQQWPAADTK